MRLIIDLLKKEIYSVPRSYIHKEACEDLSSLFFSSFSYYQGKEITMT